MRFIPRRLPKALPIACALLLATWAVAYAHATLVRAEPAANSHLAVSPPRVRLVFSEPLEPRLAHVALTSGDRRITLVVSGDPHDVHAIVAPVDSLAPGAYRVLWHVVSADGHPVDGSYVFWVNAPAAAVAPPAAAPPPPVELAPPNWGPVAVGAPLVPAVLRGLAVGNLMALVGVLAFLTLKRRAAPPPPRRVARLATALALATPLLLALHAAAWLVNASPDHTLGAEWATAALASGTGRVELWRTGLALLAAWALALARRPRLALPFALGALLVSGATGHSVAIHAAWAVPARAIHLAAAAPWIGGVLWLVACVGRVDRAAFVREALRVSAAALGGVVLVALSGVAQTLLFLPSPRDVVRSAYGAVALAKVAGLLVLVGFGAYHRYRVLPRLAADAATTGAFSRALRGELAVMTIVVLLGGLLAYVPPPTTPTP